MPQPVYDVVCGFKYHSGPFRVVEYTANTAALYEGGLLMLSGGKMSRWVAGNLPAGVAINYAPANGKVLVSVDPETIYEATDSLDTVTDAKIGTMCAVIAENPSLVINRKSSMKTALFSSYTTPNTSAPVVVIGAGKGVTNNAAASNCKVLVKLITGAFEPKIDAT